MRVKYYRLVGVLYSGYYNIYYCLHLPVQQGGPVPPLIVSLVTLDSQPGELVVGGDTVLVVTGSVLDHVDCLHLVVHLVCLA